MRCPISSDNGLRCASDGSLLRIVRYQMILNTSSGIIPYIYIIHVLTVDLQFNTVQYTAHVLYVYCTIHVLTVDLLTASVCVWEVISVTSYTLPSGLATDLP